MGLLPGAPDGSWVQPVEVVGIRSKAPETIRATKGPDGVDLRFFDDYIAYSGVQAPESRVDNAELVFVGYGIVAPEYQWDDFKGVDLKGKVLLVMNNDPEDDPGALRRQDAASTTAAGTTSTRRRRAQGRPARSSSTPHRRPATPGRWCRPRGPASSSAARRRRAARLQVRAGPPRRPAAASRSSAARTSTRSRAAAEARLQAGAAGRDPRASPSRTRSQRKQTRQRARPLPGSDPELAAEAVLYTAHHDHLGHRRPTPSRARTRSTTARSTTPRAWPRCSPSPRPSRRCRRPPSGTRPLRRGGRRGAGPARARSTSPRHPPVPAGPHRRQHQHRRRQHLRPHARPHHDRPRQVDPRRLIVAALAATQGRRSCPTSSPTAASSTAPTSSTSPRSACPRSTSTRGTDVIGKPAGWGKEQMEEYEAKDYHQPLGRAARPTGTSSGAVEDVAARASTWACKVANAPRDAGLEAGRRVRGGAEEGARCGQDGRRMSRAISGGTPKRTGTMLVPSPEVTKSRFPSSTTRPAA